MDTAATPYITGKEDIAATTEPGPSPTDTLGAAFASEASDFPPDGRWSSESATSLQQSVDRIFGTKSQSLLGLEFSFTIADPFLPDCPLIGCSTGFTKLCGYGIDDIVGHNCRFLVDPVPSDKIDKTMRKCTKDFCQAVTSGNEWMPPSDYPYAPTDRPLDEFVCMQMNARKDGTLFNNLFYMKVFDLSCEMGEEQPYIIALQSELKGGKEDLFAVSANLGKLDAMMESVKLELAKMFFVECSLSRQLIKPVDRQMSLPREIITDIERQVSRKSSNASSSREA